MQTGKYQSGQMGQTVNLLAYAFGGSNPSLPTKNCGSSSVDRALAFQAEGRGFEPRLPLFFEILLGKYQSGQMGQTVNLLAYAFGGSNPSLPTKNCGSSSVDRALAFQAEGRGFEPRLPLMKKACLSTGFFRILFLLISGKEVSLPALSVFFHDCPDKSPYPAYCIRSSRIPYRYLSYA